MDELRVQLETDHTAAMEALRAENAVDLDALRALHTETSEQITLKHSEKAARRQRSVVIGKGALAKTNPWTRVVD